jgi:hypothetical protein
MQEKTTYEWKVWAPKKRSLSSLQMLAWFVTIILSIVLVCMGIAWLASISVIMGSSVLLGHAVFLGIPPLIFALLSTSLFYLVFWPLSLITRAFRSLAEDMNRFKTHHILWGAVAYALSLAATVLIITSVGWVISFDYQDTKTHVVVDHGTLCVSHINTCPD